MSVSGQTIECLKGDASEEADLPPSPIPYPTSFSGKNKEVQIKVDNAETKAEWGASDLTITLIELAESSSLRGGARTPLVPPTVESIAIVAQLGNHTALEELSELFEKEPTPLKKCTSASPLAGPTSPVQNLAPAPSGRLLVDTSVSSRCH